MSESNVPNGRRLLSLEIASLRSLFRFELTETKPRVFEFRHFRHSASVQQYIYLQSIFFTSNLYYSQSDSRNVARPK